MPSANVNTLSSPPPRNGVPELPQAGTRNAMNHWPIPPDVEAWGEPWREREYLVGHVEPEQVLFLSSIRSLSPARPEGGHAALNSPFLIFINHHEHVCVRC